MALPMISGEARLTEDPTLRFAPSGVAVCTVNLAFNARKFDRDRNEWVDGDVLFLRGTVFKDTAESVAESLVRGTEVTVTGRLKTEQWEDKEGQKRSAVSLLIDSIGPSLRSATAVVKRANRGQGGGGAGVARQAPGEDPWATGPGGAAEPPF